MANKSTGIYGHFGEYPSQAQLPNVAGASVQTSELQVGDLAFVADLVYVCTTSTVGAAVWAAVGSSTTATINALEGFTAADHYVAPANSLPGNAAGFTVQVAIRIHGLPAGLELAFSALDINLNTGGWYLGIDNARFKFGASRQSDGALIQNFVNADFTNYWGRVQGVLHVLTMVVSGTDINAYVDGQEVFAGAAALTGGYEVSDPAITPMIGRGFNAGTPTPATTTGFVAAGYVETVLTAQQVLDQYLQTANDEAYVDPGWSNSWVAGSDPAVLDDLVGAVDFTRAGTPTSTEYRLRF